MVQFSLNKLHKLLTTLKYRTLSLIDEHATGTHTGRCSRSDLMEIAKSLPQRRDWGEAVFETCKAGIMARFCLGSRQFGLALTKLQECREMKGILGVETPLLHLGDADIVFVIEQWRRVHPKRDPNEETNGLDYFDPARFEHMREEMEVLRDVIATLDNRLSAEQIADLEVMFYLSREIHYCEEYEPWVAQKIKEHTAANDRPGEIRRLIEKTNLLQCLKNSARILGRLELAKTLEAM